MTQSVLKILEDLIAIQSVNPAFVGPASGEKAVANYIEELCCAAGLRVTRQPVLDGRDNLLIELPNEASRPTLLFQTHMDTVALGSMEEPLRPRLREGRMYGRGACDAKGCLAAMLWALLEATKDTASLHCNILLSAAADEEHRFRGVLRFLEEGLSVSGAVVGEPTGLGIVIAHKGVCRFAVQTRGKAAHSSRPDEGNNAIFQMKEVLDFIDGSVEPELAQLSHPLCGSPTIVVATISGGTQINIVPECCEIQVDRRVIPGENSREVLGAFTEALEQHAQTAGIDCAVTELLLDEPLGTAPDARVVRAAQEAAVAMGLSPSLLGVPYGSDASKLQALGGIPAIVFGPGSIDQAHSREEYVPVVQLEQAAAFYLRLMRTYGAD